MCYWVSRETGKAGFNIHFAGNLVYEDLEQKGHLLDTATWPTTAFSKVFLSGPIGLEGRSVWFLPHGVVVPHRSSWDWSFCSSLSEETKPGRRSLASWGTVKPTRTAPAAYSKWKSGSILG